MSDFLRNLLGGAPDEDQNSDQSGVLAPTAPSPAATPATPSPISPSGGPNDLNPVQASVLKRLSDAQDASKIKDAQNSARQTEMIDNILQSLDVAAHAGAHARGGSAENPAIFQQLNQQAQQNVANTQQAQHQKMSDILQANALNQGMVDQNRQNSMLTLDQGKAAETSRKDQADEAIKKADLAEKEKDRQLTRDLSTSSKATKAQETALLNTRQLLESARGNPAAAQAERDLYAAQKVDTLANLYGDPNKLSQQQVRLLASEVGKIASGGTPTMETLKGITPETLVGMGSDMVTKLTNDPTPANAAAFVKQFQDYTNGLRKDAQDVIKDKYGRVIESGKTALNSQDYKNLQDQYVNRFDTKASAKAPAGSFPRTVIKGNQQATVKNQSELDEATSEGFQ